MNPSKSSRKIHRLTLAAILTALIIIMSVTPLGYLSIGAISMSFVPVPVTLGAMVLGPAWGAVFGGVFGVTSFLIGMAGEPFIGTMLSLNPVAAIAVCLIPRILIGVFAGLLSRLLQKPGKEKLWHAVAVFLTGTLTNTVFFVGLAILFYRNTIFSGSTVGVIITSMFLVNGIAEAAVSCVLGAAFGKLLPYFRKYTV